MIRPPLLVLASLLLCACSATPVCAPAAHACASDAVPYAGVCMVSLGPDVLVDPDTTPEERARVSGYASEARRRILEAFGVVRQEHPLVIFCKRAACSLHFAGPTGRSRVVPPHRGPAGGAFETGDRVTAVIVRVDPGALGTLVHEWGHIELALHLHGAFVPAWFDEGLVSTLGDNAPCPRGPVRAIDDLRWLGAGPAWEDFTNTPGNLGASYCQARREVSAWFRRVGPSGMLALLDAVRDGGSFYDLYGPMQSPVPAPSLTSHLPLDEGTGREAFDRSGGSHIATLMAGASWVPGHLGGGVHVRGGSLVRVDGLRSLGVRDAPLSLSLWVRPDVDANVLVHASAEPDGNGWCTPLLGFDREGHLVAQIPYGPAPDLYLTATGPTLAPGAWHHVASTWSGAHGVRLYVDGVFAASGEPGTPAQRHDESGGTGMYLSYGSDRGANCWHHAIHAGDFEGALDELRTFDYELSPAQVAQEAAR